ncbi:MAG: LLM class F420-dependent oxidoreductase, partial [Anaerolineae bacterium]|nr:LLM class F420-dependent oxidoreductase [Anaerolineae bacterium]
MKLGVVFPQTEIGPDPATVRAYAEAVEGLGFAYLQAYDHVLGADTRVRPDWRGPYTLETLFHEVFVLFGYLAAITHRLELVTGILILPQRQTALVAKQAAEVDVLSGGRLRLGVGVGWNHVEYEALGMDWKTRGVRQAEQIEVMRRLWVEDFVTFEGRFHTMTDVNILPPPVQRPIPIWFGGSHEAVIKRCARLGDGWMPILAPDA